MHELASKIDLAINPVENKVKDKMRAEGKIIIKKYVTINEYNRKYGTINHVNSWQNIHWEGIVMKLKIIENKLKNRLEEINEIDVETDLVMSKIENELRNDESEELREVKNNERFRSNTVAFILEYFRKKITSINKYTVRDYEMLLEMEFDNSDTIYNNNNEPKIEKRGPSRPPKKKIEDSKSDNNKITGYFSKNI